jgi:hypothetical protein
MLNPFGTDKLVAIAAFTTSGTSGAISAYKTVYGCSVTAGTTACSYLVQLNGPFSDNEIQIMATYQSSTSVPSGVAVTYPVQPQPLTTPGYLPASYSTAVVAFNACGAMSAGSVVQILAFACEDGIDNTP